MFIRIIKFTSACGLLYLLGACAGNSQFQTLGSNLLSSTGLVSGSQADAIFGAGGKLIKAASPLSDEQEYYLGRGVAAMVFSKYRPWSNSKAIAYVNKVGNVVASASDLPETFGGYHFMVLETSEVNALSAPGGFVFLTTGFLKQISDEDSLAAVLAHEIAHVAKGHGRQAISNANLTEALTIIGREAAASQGGVEVQQLVSVFGDSIDDVFNTLITKGYSRSQEYDADAYALEILKRSGYNPSGLYTMLASLKTSAPADAENGWYATHPDPEDRQDELASEFKSGGSVLSGQSTRTARFKAAIKGLG